MAHLLFIPGVLLLGIIIGVVLAAYWTRDSIDIPETPDTDAPEEDIPLITPSLRSRRTRIASPERTQAAMDKAKRGFLS